MKMKKQKYQETTYYWHNTVVTHKNYNMKLEKNYQEITNYWHNTSVASTII